MAGGETLKTSVILAITLLITCSAGADYRSVDPDYDDQINFDSFRTAIENSFREGPRKRAKIDTIEEALNLVPKKFFDFHVLVYRSRSLQKASYLFPRAIVFGRSGKFTLAFNGHPSQRGYKQIEMIQFREKTNRWELRSATFEQGKAPVFSEPNPRRCLECHQSPTRADVDPRPNWEPYNFWPGVYSSVDSIGESLAAPLKEGLTRYFAGEQGFKPAPSERFLKQDMFLVDEQAQEQEMLTKFQTQIQPVHPRYKFLPLYKPSAPTSLAKIYAILNFRRIARLAKTGLGVLYDTYKFAVAGLSKGSQYSSDELAHRCGRLYMPQSVKAMHLQRLSAMRSIHLSDYDDHPYAPWGGEYPLEKGFDLIFEPLGISTRDWSMDFRTSGRFAAGANRYESPQSAIEHLREAIKIIDPDLARFNCNELEQQSYAALGDFEFSGGLGRELKRVAQLPTPPRQPLINRCISCHVEGEDGVAPAIPFNDLTALKPLLKQGQYARGTLLDEIRYRTSDHAPFDDKMPPSGQFDTDQRDELMKIFEYLAGEQKPIF